MLLVRRRNSLIASVMSSVLLNVSFRRTLVVQNLASWHNLCASIVHIHLTEENDIFRWDFHQNGQFSVGSMYLALIDNGYIESVGDTGLGISRLEGRGCPQCHVAGGRARGRAAAALSRDQVSGSPGPLRRSPHAVSWMAASEHPPTRIYGDLSRCGVLRVRPVCDWLIDRQNLGCQAHYRAC